MTRMRYFDYLSFGWFYDRPDGTWLFAPWGTAGQGYVMTTADRRRFVAWWGWLTIGFIAGFTVGQWLGGAGVFLALLAFFGLSAWAAIRVMTRGLTRVKVERTMLERPAEYRLRAARAAGRTLLSILILASGTLATLCVWAAIDTGRFVFIVGALFFGVGAWQIVRQWLLVFHSRQQSG